MDDKRFWDVIAVACPHEAVEEFYEPWYGSLVETLATLPPELVVRFGRWFDDKTDALYSHDHWGAAYLINGGASDDGFYYWRCWLVGMGKAVYEAALKDPDTLAGVVAPDCEASEAEIYSAAREAWRRQKRKEKDFDRACGALSEGDPERLKGRRWNFDDDRQIRKRFPRLAALYLDRE